MSGLLSGVLPAVYSAGDKLKRQLGGLLSDPAGTLQQHVGLLNDNARAFNQLHSKATQEAVDSLKSGGNGWGPASQQIAGKLADAYNPMGMVVWHGSPHKFSKFDASKIGTGEGAQAYGHGLYLAESPDVANSYLKASNGPGATRPDWAYISIDGAPLEAVTRGMEPSVAGHIASVLTESGGNVQDAAKAFRAMAAGSESSPVVKNVMSVLERAKSADLSKIPSGSLYKVDLPDDAIAKMLDWDKPLSQQAPTVKDAINRVGRSPESYGLERVADDMRMVEMQKLFQSREGVEALRQHGIPGIRYLDGGSRGAGSGTSNFVVFPGNEGLLTILERNGQAIK